MLIVNPEERVNITDVINYCGEQIKIMDKKYRDSPYLDRASRNQSHSSVQDNVGGVDE